MITLDEDALVCDFAETYHIYDYRGLPLELVGVLACGLREDSRIKMKLSNRKISLDSLLLAGIVDRLSLLVWAQTKDASKGRNRPKSVLDDLLVPEENKYKAFNSIEEFEKAHKLFMGG